MDISPAYLHALIHKGKKPDAVVCAKIANHYGLSLTDVFRMAGYMDAGQSEDRVEQMIAAVSDRLRQDPDLQEIVQAYLASRSAGERKRLRDVVVAAAGNLGI